MAKHYDAMYWDHIRNGRDTIEKMFTVSDSQRFDVGISYPMDYYRDMKKKFEVTVSKTATGRALLEVKDPLGKWETKTAFLALSTKLEDVYKTALDFGCDMREEHLMKFLHENGFRED